MSQLEIQNVIIFFFVVILLVTFFSKRFRSAIFLLPAWFSPHSKLRVFFHKLRGIKIGNAVEIGYYVHLDNEMPQLITLRDNVTVTNNCVLLAHDHSNSYTGTSKKDKVAPILVDEFAFIGSSSIILPGVTIGKRAIVGAGSVVTRNVESEALVAGNPAKKLKRKI